MSVLRICVAAAYEDVVAFAGGHWLPGGGAFFTPRGTHAHHPSPPLAGWLPLFSHRPGSRGAGEEGSSGWVASPTTVWLIRG